MRINFPPEAESARSLGRRIVAAGGEAFLIGGCVRDLCLGLAPKDFDLATSLLPEEILALWPGANETGKSFGVVRVRHDEQEIEIATFRRDGPYSDGRRPDFVEFTSLEEDLRRRDFTINALAAELDSGEVIDRVGGLADLAAGVIRAVGEPEARFREDRLRLIRAVRFAHRLGFAIEPRTWEAIRSMAATIGEVAKERISDEFTRMLCRTPSGSALRLLDASGLLKVILPEVTRLKGVAQPEQFHPEGDVFIHTLMVMDELQREPSPALAWAALLHDVGKPATFMVTDRIRFHGHAELGAEMARAIGRRFRLANAVIDRIHSIILEHQRFADVDEMRPGRLLRWATMPHFTELLEMHRADCAASHRDMSAHRTAIAALEEIQRLAAQPKRLVTGETLIELGLAPGPRFKELLERCFEAQLEGIFHDAEGARRFAGCLAARDPGSGA